MKPINFFKKNAFAIIAYATMVSATLYVPNLAQAQDNQAKPHKIEVEEQLNLELRMFFDHNQAVVKPQYLPEINKVANAMKAFPNSTITIEGYTASTEEQKQALSQARANAIKSMLVKQGIASSRIKTAGYADSKPIANNNTAEGQTQNRRIYAIVTGSRKTYKYLSQEEYALITGSRDTSQ